MIPEPTAERLALLEQLPADWREQIAVREKAASRDVSTVMPDLHNEITCDIFRPKVRREK